MGYQYGVISKPVSMDDIGTAISHSSRDLGTLCKTTNDTILKSFYKPFNGSVMFEATVTQRRQYNWGWKNLGAGANGLYNTLIAKWNGGTWQHDLPQGGTGSPYRMLDWAGYNSAAEQPFQITLNKSTISTIDGLNFTMSNIDELQHLHEWGWMGNTTKAKMGFGVYIGTSAPSANGFWIYMLAGPTFGITFEDLLGNEKFAVPAVHFTNISATSGTYYVIPFVVPDASGMGTNQSVYITNTSAYSNCIIFPQNKVSFTITSAVIPVNKITMSLSDSSYSVDDSSLVFTLSSMVIGLRNTNTSSRTVSISAKPTSSQIEGNIIQGSFKTQNVTIAANSSTTVQMVNSTLKWKIPTLGAQVDVTITDSGNSATQTFTIYSDKE